MYYYWYSSNSYGICMIERLHYIDLYDVYGQLLTDKQQKYFEDYYFNNLSLSEISENEGITRNAIHKHIKDAIDKLEYYEVNIKVLEKTKKIIKFSEKLNEKEQKELKELL